MLCFGLPPLVISLPSLSKMYKERLIAHLVPDRAIGQVPAYWELRIKESCGPPLNPNHPVPPSQDIEFRHLRLHISNPECLVVYMVAEYS